MKIKYVSEDDLNAIKSNLEPIFKRVIKNKECSIEELLGKDRIIRESALSIDDFCLDMSQPKENASLTDTENVQRVYNHMRFLSDSQASDERVWSAYAFFEFFDYMCYRWPAIEGKDLTNHYLFGYSAQRSLFRNGIARLWWIGRFSYDNSRPDPYELTKFLCKNQDYIESFCGRNIFNNHEIGIGVLSALLDAEKRGLRVDRDMVRDVAKYSNLLAGTYLLDSFERDDIYEKISKKIITLQVN